MTQVSSGKSGTKNQCVTIEILKKLLLYLVKLNMKPCKVFRPTLDDVERLSEGKGARRRGTGSKYVCHRLNRDERILFEIAKQAGYLSIQGSSYRKERKGSPIRNTFRQRCDALERVCVIIEKRNIQDRILIDFSTLRMKDDTAAIKAIVIQTIETKYPDLYPSMQILCKEEKIVWDDVKSLPIWNIDQRLVVIDCDRHVAKSLAVDILKLSDKFDTTVYENDESEILDEKDFDDEGRKHDRSKDNNELYNNDDTDEIDWDDI